MPTGKPEAQSAEELRSAMASGLAEANLAGYLDAASSLVELLTREAMLHSEKAQWEQAVECLSSATSVSEEMVALMDEADLELRALVRVLGPERRRFFEEQGIVLDSGGGFGGAFADARRLLASVGEQGEALAYYFRAHVLYNRGEYEPATESFVEAAPALEKLSQGGDNFEVLARSASDRAALSRARWLWAEDKWDAARRAFAEAARAFAALPPEELTEGSAYPYIARWATGMEELASGNEYFSRGTYERAAAAFMRARVLFDDLEEVMPEDSDIVLQFFRQKSAIESLAAAAQLERASYMSRYSLGDYQAAARHADACLAAWQQLHDEMPPESAKSDMNVFRSLISRAEGDKELAAGHVLRASEQWEEAEAAYERSRAALESAATYMLKAGLPDATAQQEALMATASLIAIWVRESRAEQELKEQIKALRSERQSLLERINSAGTTVNNYNEATAIAEANTQVAVRVADDVKGLLPELRAAIDNAGLGMDGEKLKAEVADLEASNESPKSFLERTAEVTKKVAEIANNIGDAAAPVLSVIQKIAPLVGLVSLAH